MPRSWPSNPGGDRAKPALWLIDRRSGPRDLIFLKRELISSANGSVWLPKEMIIGGGETVLAGTKPRAWPEQWPPAGGETIVSCEETATNSMPMIWKYAWSMSSGRVVYGEYREAENPVEKVIAKVEEVSPAPPQVTREEAAANQEEKGCCNVS